MESRTTMRTVLITALMFLIALTTPSYAGIFRDNQPENGNSYRSNNSYHSNHSNSSRTTSYPNAISYSNGETGENSGGFFRSTSNDDPLKDRPGMGGGIGQSAPISKGMHTLLVCCLIYGIVKFSAKKRSEIY